MDAQEAAEECVKFLKEKLSKEDLKRFKELFFEAGLTSFGNLLNEIQ